MDESTALMLLPREEVYAPQVEVLDPEDVPGFMPSDGAQAFINAMARAVVAAQEAPKLSEREKARHWALAFDEWLSETPKTGQPRPAATVAAYSAAWEDFRMFCPKQPWRVEGLDIKAWVDDLRTRPIAAHVAKGLVRNGRRHEGQLGLSDATVNQWLAGISAFYSFAETYEVRTGDGRTGETRIVALFDGVNPAKSRAVKRPKAQPFEKTMYLDIAQLRALLDAIRQHRPVNAAKALRDYALFMCYISTGARNSEVRVWKWGDIERRGAVTYYRWSNKGKSGRDEVPSDAWAAVEDYLRISGRLASIKDGDYIFTPLSDNITRMKRLDGTHVVDPATWDPNRPLSQQEVNRNLRQYARKAGIESDRLHVHCLRHSAYMLYREAGLSLEERSRLLHHSSLAITSIYDHAVAGQRNVGWSKASSLLGL